ncbi:hypothetical protein K438DRAFT_1756750 [Mycena galopus ATCC 62051]|nr:hypothetical protein K438DRAFT_1756750 [Mycena galopus ATCC 62051]
MEGEEKRKEARRGRRAERRREDVVGLGGRKGAKARLSFRVDLDLGRGSWVLLVQIRTHAARIPPPPVPLPALHKWLPAPQHQRQGEGRWRRLVASRLAPVSVAANDADAGSETRAAAPSRLGFHIDLGRVALASHRLCAQMCCAILCIPEPVRVLLLTTTARQDPKRGIAIGVHGDEARSIQGKEENPPQRRWEWAWARAWARAWVWVWERGAVVRLRSRQGRWRGRGRGRGGESLDEDGGQRGLCDWGQQGRWRYTAAAKDTKSAATPKTQSPTKGARAARNGQRTVRVDAGPRVFRNGLIRVPTHWGPERSATAGKGGGMRRGGSTAFTVLNGGNAIMIWSAPTSPRSTEIDDRRGKAEGRRKEAAKTFPCRSTPTDDHVTQSGRVLARGRGRHACSTTKAGAVPARRTRRRARPGKARVERDEEGWVIRVGEDEERSAWVGRMNPFNCERRDLAGPRRRSVKARRYSSRNRRRKLKLKDKEAAKLVASDIGEEGLLDPRLYGGPEKFSQSLCFEGDLANDLLRQRRNGIPRLAGRDP